MVNYEGEVTSQRDAVDRAFAALADPVRRQVVERLARGEAVVSELAAPFAMSLPGFMKHLRVLEQAGVIECVKRGRSRHCRLSPVGLRHAASWFDQHRHFWEGQFDRLEKYLKDSEEKP